MKEKIIDFIVEFICIIIVYILIMLAAYKFKLIESFDALYLSMGFIIGWATVRVTDLFHSKRKKEK